MRPVAALASLKGMGFGKLSFPTQNAPGLKDMSEGLVYDRQIHSTLPFFLCAANIRIDHPLKSTTCAFPFRALSSVCVCRIGPRANIYKYYNFDAPLLIEPSSRGQHQGTEDGKHSV